MQSTTLNHLPPYYISAWGKPLHEDQLILGWSAELSCLWWNNSHPAVSEASCLVWSGPSFKLASVTTNHSLKKTCHSSCPWARWLSSRQRLIGKCEEQRTGFVFQSSLHKMSPNNVYLQCHAVFALMSSVLLWISSIHAAIFYVTLLNAVFLILFLIFFYAVRLL